MHPVDFEKRQQALCALLMSKIELNHGAISFAEFMQTVLYTPQLGYYTSSQPKFGAQGDFVTAPEISKYFSWCIAKYCQNTIKQIGDNKIIEFGAGSGVMAAEILLYLARHDALPEEYAILELSANLIDLQYITIQEKCPQALSRVKWLTKLPEKWCGVVLANEVLDAMPVHVFELKGGTLYEKCVTHDSEKFIWTQSNVNTALQAQLEIYRQKYLVGVEDYESEVSLLIPQWLHSINKMIDRGTLLLIDYGFSASEYYHPQRHTGTLMCHYKQQALSDPFVNIGAQDITAHVDFSLLAHTADALAWNVDMYTPQAFFLLSHGLMEFAQQTDDYNAIQAIKRLTLPHEMGELFKVMSLSKNCKDLVQNDLLRDLRYQL